MKQKLLLTIFATCVVAAVVFAAVNNSESKQKNEDGGEEDKLATAKHEMEEAVSDLVDEKNALAENLEQRHKETESILREAVQTIQSEELDCTDTENATALEELEAMLAELKTED